MPEIVATFKITDIMRWLHTKTNPHPFCEVVMEEWWKDPNKGSMREVVVFDDKSWAFKEDNK